MLRPCWRLAFNNKPWLEFANALPKGKRMIDETRYLSATKVSQNWCQIQGQRSYL
jgi:hypothetical protein